MSVLHVLCLVAQVVQLVKEYTHWVQSVVTSCLCLVFDSTTEANKPKGAAKSALPVATDKGDAVANLEAWGDWRIEAFDDTPGVLLVNVRSYVNAGYDLILSIICEICATIFSAKNV